MKIQRIKKTHNIPRGTIIYSDLDTPSKPLFSKKFDLSGKPDYIIQDHTKIYPVEIKTGQHHKPKNHHIMQLVAYCHLVEQTFHQQVPYGLLIYEKTGKKFQISYNQKTQGELEKTMQQMRYHLYSNEIDTQISHEERCSACSMHQYCPKHPKFQQ